jgi:hypothetical protein
MSFSTDAVTVILLAVVAALVAGILAFVIRSRLDMRRRQRDIVVLRAAIIDYFLRTGVEVSADCSELSNGCFIAIIESEPMKRFRLSHIIEMTVREHVRKACGKELEKIYWRFPVREAAQMVPEAVPDEVGKAVANHHPAESTATPVPKSSDDYINEGLEHYRHIPKPEVEELSWESFEQVAIRGQESRPGEPKS